MDGLKVIKSVDSLTYENEIRCPQTFGIRKNEHFEPMIDSSAGSSKKRLVIICLIIDGRINVNFILYGMKLASLAYLLQLTREIYTCQRMQLCQFKGYVTAVSCIFFHTVCKGTYF